MPKQFRLKSRVDSTDITLAVHSINRNMNRFGVEYLTISFAICDETRDLLQYFANVVIKQNSVSSIPNFSATLPLYMNGYLDIYDRGIHKESWGLPDLQLVSVGASCKPSLLTLELVCSALWSIHSNYF